MIMKQIIRLKDIYASDLYTRSRAAELRKDIIDDASDVTLDFNGIGFMSRSFADELCNIIDSLGKTSFHYINRNADVEAMMTKVAEGRNRERKRGISTARMLKFHDMESLSQYLLAI